MSTPDSIKTQIQNLIATANTTTGNSDTDLTTAITSLINGFGGGGDVTYNGLRYNEGTVYFDGKNNNIINHNSGFIPDIFILYPKFDVTAGSADEEVAFIGYYGKLFDSIPSSLKDACFVLENRTTYTNCVWQLASTQKNLSGLDVPITDTQILIPYRSNSYAFRVAEYGWIAISENTENESVDYLSLANTITFSADALKTHYDDMYLNLVNATTIAGMLDNRPIMFEKVVLNISEKCTTFQNTFRGSSVIDPLLHNLKTIIINGSTSGVTTFYSAFKGRFETEEIVGVLDFSSCTAVQDMFYNCKVLREVRFAEGTLNISLTMKDCGVLSDSSIQSIIDGLADLTDLETQTITFHEDVKAKLTESQISQITSKNWTLA